jgi:hypothetical protein
MTSTFVIFAPSFDQRSLTESAVRRTINATFDMSSSSESPNLVDSVKIIDGQNGKKIAFVEVFSGASRRFNHWFDLLQRDGIEYITYSGETYWTCRPKKEKSTETITQLPRFA